MNGFLREVLTQGNTLQNLLDYYEGEGARQLDAIIAHVKERDFKRIVLTGMGSSMYATHAVQSLLTQSGIPTLSFSAFELSRYQFKQIDASTLVIAISQSGESFEVIELIRKANALTTTVGISNREASTVYREATFGLGLIGGTEKSITSITYAHTIFLLNLFAFRLLDKDNVSFMGEINSVISWAKTWCDNWLASVEELAKMGDGIALFDYIANDTSQATSRQLALACREGLHNAAASWECADYAHGQYHSSKLSSAYLAQMFIPVLENDTKEQKMLDFILDRGGKVILYTTQDLPQRDNLQVVLLPSVYPSLIPIIESIAAETLLGYWFGPNWVKDH